MLKHKNGDLLNLAKNGEFDVIVHGANCHCVFGAGIANQIKLLYPCAYVADLKTVTGDSSKIGNYSHEKTHDGFTIVNAYTQYDFNRRGEVIDLFGTKDLKKF